MLRHPLCCDMARFESLRIAPAIVGVVLLMLSAVVGQAQTQGGGTGPVYPVLKVTVTAVDEEAAQGGHVSPMRWHEDILDFSRLYANEEEYRGHLAAKVQCQLVEVNLNGWTRQSVWWTPNEDLLLAVWQNFGWQFAPAVGFLLHEGNGAGMISPGGQLIPSIAFNYHLGEARAGCDVVYTKPGHDDWVQRINADSDEMMLAVGGPLKCGVHFDDDRPFWDDGFKSSDLNRTQHAPWYLDRYDATNPFASTDYGQDQQLGVIQLRFGTQPEFVTQLLWQFEGEPGVRYLNGTAYVVASPAMPTAVRIAALSNTIAGAIRPAVRYKGTYRGENFDFGDLSEDCPPPGTFTLNEHYYRYTGHKPKSIEQSKVVTYTPQSAPTSGFYNAYSDYWLRVRDESDREMMGSWVQERWDSVQFGPVYPNVNPTLQAFHVNTSEGFHWITGRGDDVANRGVFLSADSIGYNGVHYLAWEGNGIIFQGIHVYWAGTKWAPTLYFNAPTWQFLQHPNQSPPAAGLGLGIELARPFRAIGRTRGPSHSAVPPPPPPPAP